MANHMGAISSHIANVMVETTFLSALPTKLPDHQCSLSTHRGRQLCAAIHRGAVIKQKQQN